MKITNKDIKLIIFDLDGVLVEAKDIHYNALNAALGEEYSISMEEHLSTYDGLKTNEKLNILSIKKQLPRENHKEIFDLKQKYTIEMLSSLEQNQELIDLMKHLNENNVKIAVASNSIRKTCYTVLSKLGLMEYIDLILSNEDVQWCKPHPEIYWKAMKTYGVNPEYTVIVEDSPNGLLAAHRSNAHTMRVNAVSETTIYNVINYINGLNDIKNDTDKISSNPKWINKKINVVIPMAGLGSRFSSAGYTFPKPLIEVNGKPMIQLVVENLNLDAHYIFIVRKEHSAQYNLKVLLNMIAPNCSIIEIDHVTDGAACTALLAKELINNENPLFFANSDQFVEWNSSEFFYKMQESKVDGGICTFESTHPKWSFAKVDENGFVTRVEEKNPISNLATVGFYYWKHGSDFVKYAEQMIDKNIRVNNEFYVCPVYNEAIGDNKKITTFDIQKMWGIGTPEDLNYYLNFYGKV